jgi:hypothetical protein
MYYIEGAKRKAKPAGPPKLNHPLGELLVLPRKWDRPLSVVWALGKNENVQAITKKDWDHLDAELVE